jgi:hypothetical protein
MPDLLFELFSEEIPARMQAKTVDHLLPSSRARSAWWGGVGGGGCLPQRTLRAVDHRALRSRALAIDTAINADRPPTPDPSPPQAGGGE